MALSKQWPNGSARNADLVGGCGDKRQAPQNLFTNSFVVPGFHSKSTQCLNLRCSQNINSPIFPFGKFITISKWAHNTTKIQSKKFLKSQRKNQLH
jgi:hypothetical protein